MNRSPYRILDMLAAAAVSLALATPALANESSSAEIGNGAQPAADPVALQWGDFDGDAFQDAVVVTPQGQLSLLQNRADGGFMDVTEMAGLEGVSGVELVLFADYDQDGLADLFVATRSGTQLLLNRGFGFTDVTPSGGFGLSGSVRSAHWVDYDLDGLLDLHVVTSSENVLLHSLGERRFESVPLSTVVDNGAPSGFGAGLPGSGGTSSNPDQGSSGTGPSGTAPPVSQGPGSTSPTGLISSGGTLDIRPNLPGGSSSRPGTSGSYDATFCALSLADAASAGCLQASSVPMLGMLYPLSQNLFVDSATGNVGLGTVSPGQPLHIQSDSASAVALLQGISAQLRLVRTDTLSESSVRFNLDGGAPGWFIGTDNKPTQYVEDLVFKRNNNGAPDVIVTQADGNVGIGTGTPTVPLQVMGTNVTLASGGYIMAGSAGGVNLSMDNDEIQARNNGAAYLLNLNYDGGDVILGGSGNSNVGIGTQSPLAPLHVAGTADTGTGLVNNGLLVTGSVTGKNISMDANEIMARDNGVESRLLLNGQGGNVIIGGQSGASDGFLGIGTTSPLDVLHIVTGNNSANARLEGFSATVDLRRSNATAGSSSIVMRNGGSTKWTTGMHSSTGDDFVINRGVLQETALNVSTLTGNVGIGAFGAVAPLQINGSETTGLTTDGLLVIGTANNKSLSLDGNEIQARVGNTAGSFSLNRSGGFVGIGTSSPGTTLDVNGAITIRGGADIVESFESSCGVLEPGTVVVIDPDRPGMLMCSGSAYDTKVAGVVSGAGGVKPGLMLGQDDMFSGDTKVAMTGRVYVKCTTEGGPVLPGDRLTTSSLDGYAMRVVDGARADGAVIGKAMSSLEDGTGLVLVLVNLQ